jgi:hypothetical protein
MRIGAMWCGGLHADRWRGRNARDWQGGLRVDAFFTRPDRGGFRTRSGPHRTLNLLHDRQSDRQPLAG